MNYISLCLEGSRTSEFEPSDRKDIMSDKVISNNKGTYDLVFSINAESVDMAVQVLHDMPFEEKLNYLIEA